MNHVGNIAPVRRLWLLEGRFLRPHRRTIASAALGMLVGSLLLLPIPFMQGLLIDRLIEAEGRHESAVEAGRMIALILGASIGCYLVRTALVWKIAATMSRVSLEVVREVTDAMHRKLQRLPIAYYHREQTGRIMARITSDVGSLLIFLNSASLQLASDLIMAVGIAATIAWLDWRLALIVMATVPFFALNHRFFSRRSHRAAARIRSQVASMYALLSERLSAMRVVRSFAQEEIDLDEFVQYLDEHADASLFHHRSSAIQGALALLVSGLGTAAILYFGVAAVQKGTLSVGELLAFYALAVQFFGPIIRLAHFNGIVSATSNAVIGIADLFDEPETVRDCAGALPLAHAHGGLEFQDVSFAYPDGLAVLRNVSVKIEPGTTVGILGPTGAGKSTLLTLAARLHDLAPAQGVIRFDGTDIKKLRLADLRRSVAVVPQNAILFDGTIRSNLTFARPDASAAAIREVLAISELASFVEGLPLGLDTPVVERGANFSGGQRQRIALARALLSDPAILLLDDCTSALDAVTEARIMTSLATRLTGRTRVIVSHKVAAVAAADLIVVLDAGHIVEQGTPRELMARAGFYAQCVAIQSPQLTV